MTRKPIAAKIAAASPKVASPKRTPSIAAANLKVGQKISKLRQKYNDLEFVNEDRDGKATIVVYSDHLGTDRKAALEKDGVVCEAAKEPAMEPDTKNEEVNEAPADAPVDEDMPVLEHRPAPEPAPEKKRGRAAKSPEEKAAAAAAKEAAKAEAKAAKEAAKAEAKAAKEPKVPEKWRTQFDRSALKKQAMLKEGKVIFRPGSKRDIVWQLLKKGTTMTEAMAATGWDRTVVSSAFYETVQLVGAPELRKALESGKEPVYSIAS